MFSQALVILFGGDFPACITGHMTWVASQYTSQVTGRMCIQTEGGLLTGGGWSAYTGVCIPGEGCLPIHGCLHPGGGGSTYRGSASRGLVRRHPPPPDTTGCGQQAGGTHSTGMISCFWLPPRWKKRSIRDLPMFLTKWEKILSF